MSADRKRDVVLATDDHRVVEDLERRLSELSVHPARANSDGTHKDSLLDVAARPADDAYDVASGLEAEMRRTAAK